MAEPGVLFGSDGEGVPEGVGFSEELGGTFAAEPVDIPWLAAGDCVVPVLSRCRNSTSAAIKAMTGMMR